VHRDFTTAIHADSDRGAVTGPVVVARWSKNLDVIFIIFRVLCNFYIKPRPFLKKNEFRSNVLKKEFF
jgi:hypothetical protein